MNVGDITQAVVASMTTQTADGKHRISERQKPTVEELAKDFKAKQEERRRREADALKQKAFSEGRLLDWTFENDDGANEEVSRIAKAYVDNFYKIKHEFTNNGLLLYGDVGTGKSFIAACIANALMDEGFSCLFTSFPSIIYEFQDKDFGEKKSYLDSFGKYDLLIIDDFGVERESDFTTELIYRVLETRRRSGRPVILTTNYSGNDLKHPDSLFRKRIFSRLFEMCIPVEVKGTDRRKLRLRDETAELKELLQIT